MRYAIYLRFVFLIMLVLYYLIPIHLLLLSTIFLSTFPQQIYTFLRLNILLKKYLSSCYLLCVVISLLRLGTWVIIFEFPLALGRILFARIRSQIWPSASMLIKFFLFLFWQSSCMDIEVQFQILVIDCFFHKIFELLELLFVHILGGESIVILAQLQ